MDCKYLKTECSGKYMNPKEMKWEIEDFTL